MFGRRTSWTPVSFSTGSIDTVSTPAVRSLAATSTATLQKSTSTPSTPMTQRSGRGFLCCWTPGGGTPSARVRAREIPVFASIDPIVGVSFTGLFDYLVHALGSEWLDWMMAGRPDGWPPLPSFSVAAESAFLKRWRLSAHRASRPTVPSTVCVPRTGSPPFSLPAPRASSRALAAAGIRPRLNASSVALPWARRTPWCPL